jgi:hypothetical protein
MAIEDYELVLGVVENWGLFWEFRTRWVREGREMDIYVLFERSWEFLGRGKNRVLRNCEVIIVFSGNQTHVIILNHTNRELGRGNKAFESFWC